MALTKTSMPPSIVAPTLPPTRKSCQSTNAIPAYDGTKCDHGAARDRFERRGDVLQADEIDQACEVIAEKTQPRDRAPVSRRRAPRRRRSAGTKTQARSVAAKPQAWGSIPSRPVDKTSVG